jgi:hypothetical protein
MAKVKVYDLRTALRCLTDGKCDLPFSEINAAIVGKDKVILTDDEAIHTIQDLSKQDLTLSPVLVDSLSIPAIAVRVKVEVTAKVSLCVKDIIDHVGHTQEIELGEYVRRHGSRIEDNYDLLLGSIRDIGLDPKDYPRGKIVDGKWSMK